MSIKLTIELPEGLYDKVKELGEQEFRSPELTVAWIINDWITEQWVKKIKAKRSEAQSPEGEFRATKVRLVLPPDVQEPEDKSKDRP